MAKTKGHKRAAKRPIEQYDHAGKKRMNNPPVGLVTPETDQAETKRTYAYDPYLDPAPQWAGNAERTSFGEIRKPGQPRMNPARANPARAVDSIVSN